MAITSAFAIEELRKKIEYLSIAHDNLTAIVDATVKVVKTLKTYHRDDFKERLEEQQKLKATESKRRLNSQRNNLKKQKVQQSMNVRQVGRNQNTNKQLLQSDTSGRNFEDELKKMTEQFNLLQSQIGYIVSDTQKQHQTQTQTQNETIETITTE